MTAKEGEDRDNMEPGADVICLNFNIKEKQWDESLHLVVSIDEWW